MGQPYVRKITGMNQHLHKTITARPTTSTRAQRRENFR
jgi:hypothetical protein